MVPTGQFSSEFEAFSVVSASDEVDRKMPDDGHIFCPESLADTAKIVLERYIENPVQGVFDLPVGADGLKKFHGAQRA